jgi:hypothetical protein
MRTIVGRAIAALLAIVTVSVQAAAAQEHGVFAQSAVRQPNGTLRSTLYEGRLVAGQVVSATPLWTETSLWQHQAPMALGGGRWVAAWASSVNGRSLLLYDRVTGTGSRVPIDIYTFDGQASAPSVPMTATFVDSLIDPDGPRLYFQEAGTASQPPAIGVLTASGRAVLAGTGGLTPVALSRDRRRLYAYRRDSFSAAPAAAVIVDAFTGQTLRDTPFPTSYATITGPTFSDDESTIWLMTRSAVSSTGAWYLRRLDGFTGAEVFSVTFDTSVDGFREFRMLAPQLDERRQRVIVSTWQRSYSSVDIFDGPGRITTLDANTGAPIGLSETVGPMSLFIDGTSDLLLTASQSILTEMSVQCSPLTVLTQDLGSLAVLGSTTVDAGACFVVGFAASPAAPRTPSASLDQGTVTVQWQPPAETVTGYVVEAGTAPGLANIASFPMPGTTLVVPNVPSGRYFVRIRARNYIGWGVPTDDIVVDVP